MTKPLRRLIAGLSITTAALTGGLLTANTAAADTGTTVGTDDTWWGTPPNTDTPGGTPVAPMDTWWG